MPRERPLWRRPAWLGLGLLLLLNLIGLAAFTLPRSVKARRLDARLLELQAQIETHRQESEQLKLRQQLLQENARDAERLLDHLVGRRETTLVPVLAELERHASELGVTAGTRALAPEELDDTPLTQLEMTIPLEGSYARLVGFLRRLEHSKAFLTVDRVRLSHRDDRNAGHTTLDITVSAYFSSAPSQPAAGGATRER